MLVSAFLVLAAGFFEDAAFAAGEAVAALFLDLFQDLVDAVVGRRIGGVGIEDAELGLRSQSLPQRSARQKSLEPPAPLIVEEGEHGAAQVSGEGDVAGTMDGADGVDAHDRLAPPPTSASAGRT